MSSDTVPLEVLRACFPGEVEAQAFLAAPSDLSLAGELETTWLVAAAGELVHVTPDLRPRVLDRWRLEDVEKIRSESTVGSGLLQLKIQGGWRDVVRFSNRHAYRFGRFVLHVQEMKKSGTVPILRDKEEDPHFCTRCAKPLARKGDVCPWCLDAGVLIRWAVSMLGPHRKVCGAIIALTTTTICINLVPPKLQQRLVDGVLNSPGGKTEAELSHALVLIVLTLAAVTVASNVVRLMRQRLGSRLGTRLTLELQNQMIERLQERTVSYHDHRESGILRSRVASDAQCIHQFLQQFTGGFFLDLLQVVGIGIMLFTLDPYLAALTLLPGPLVFWVGRSYWTRVMPNYFRYWSAIDRQAVTLGNLLTGMRIVKAFTQESREEARFRAITSNVRTARLAVADAGVGYSVKTHLLFSAGGLIVWYAGGRQVLGGEMTLGSMMAFLAYLGMFYQPLQDLADLNQWTSDFLTSAQRCFDVLHGPADRESNLGQATLVQAKGEIRFEGVSFGYDAHKAVLKEVSMVIAPGETVGIVGKSGSGKTTLVNLICRFYEPTEGTIRIDGTDIREMPAAELRRHIGVVLQEPFLFHGTIWENLIYGRPEVSVEDGLAAAYAANVHDFVSKKPFCYESQVGNRGQGLSGGERQRLSIARALLYDPRILILDEATSSVDVETEKAIQDALHVISQGRTVLAIAHRLSTLRNAHRILVFDKGELIESGTQQELMASGGRYARMVRLQTQLTRDATIDDLADEDKKAEKAKKAAAVPAELAPAEPTPTEPTPSELSPPVEPAPEVGPEADGTAVAVQPEPPTGVPPADRPPPALPEAPRAFTPRWILPGSVTFEKTAWGGFVMVEGEGARHEGIVLRRLFPATRPASYLSVVAPDEEGHPKEIGLIAHLAEWPAGIQSLLGEALARRYLIRPILEIRSVRETFGFLIFELKTAAGWNEVLLPWADDIAQPYGDHGLLLEDVSRNQYLIPDRRRLTAVESDLVDRYLAP